MRLDFLRVAVLGAVALAGVSVLAQAPTPAGDDARFRSGVDLVNVTATVTDELGRFVPGLTERDFRVFEDGEPQSITNFSNQRVPVSLGILLDTSGSMTSEKMSSARQAINRMVFDLLGPMDEFFFMQFASVPDLLQGWTNDRAAIGRALSGASASGGTAMYDAIARAIPIAADGRNEKKAILVISDGNDTNSQTTPGQLRAIIREGEVMVYALGVDGTPVSTFTPPQRRRQQPPTGPRFPVPFPRPGGGGRRFPGGAFPSSAPSAQIQFPPPGGGQGRWAGLSGERVNEDALRAITDDTGGRTEIVRGFADLDGATAHIADELSKQYFFAYDSKAKHDGRWHVIRVDMADPRLRVQIGRAHV